ncbi:MAG: hypothetical protein M0D55_00100 [Elusimicrobiota bacterium]|nr:MAG: hypothetical protein M0D55_00100 [Elusimicrobiota bacterium]
MASLAGASDNELFKRCATAALLRTAFNGLAALAGAGAAAVLRTDFNGCAAWTGTETAMEGASRVGDNVNDNVNDNGEVMAESGEPGGSTEFRVGTELTEGSRTELALRAT